MPDHPTRDDIQLLHPDFHANPFERFAWMRAATKVLFTVLRPPMKLVSVLVGTITHLLVWPFKLLLGVKRDQPPVPGGTDD